MTVPSQGWSPPGSLPQEPPPRPPQEQQAQPSSDYTTPGWFTGLEVAKRISDNLPLVVYPSLAKRSLQFGGLALFFLLGGAFEIVAAFADRSRGHTVQFVITAIPMLVGAVALAAQLYLSVSGGPILAADHAGLWIKTRPTRGQAIWLPWEGIEQIYRRRWAVEKNLCVKARDPRARANLGAYTTFDASMQRLVFGSDFSATLVFGSRSEQEIMAAIVALSAGRCPIF
jgi:hypothetical protein